MADTSIYDREVARASTAHGVPADWIKATIGAETSFTGNPRDVWEPRVNEYSYGPMNVLLSTARSLGFSGSAAELREPATNIYWGTALLAEIRDRIGSLDFRRIYSAYNSGSPDSWLSSNQVAANVARAITWLNQFTPAEEAISPALLVLGVFALAVAYRSQR